MALPTGPIPLVAFDEVIEESWGDSVAQSLNNQTEQFDRVEWIPSAPITAPISTSTWTHWFTIGGDSNEVTVPDWNVGHGVDCHVYINGIRENTATTNSYDLRLLFGSAEGRSIRMSSSTSSTAVWFGAAWFDHFEVPDPGNRPIKVEAKRVSGSDRWTIDGDSDITISFTFHGAIS